MLYYTDNERGAEIEKEDNKMERKNVESRNNGVMSPSHNKIMGRIELNMTTINNSTVGFGLLKCTAQFFL